MPRGRPKNGGVKTTKKLSGQQSVNSAVKSICDVMRRSNCAGALQYVPELTWILFLRILDEREAVEAEAVGVPFQPSLESPYRWHDWAAPCDKEVRGSGPGVGFVGGRPRPMTDAARRTEGGAATGQGVTTGTGRRMP